MLQICSRTEVKKIVDNPTSRNLLIISINDTEASRVPTWKEDQTQPPFDPNDAKISDCVIVNFDDVLKDNDFRGAKAISDNDAENILKFAFNHLDAICSQTTTVLIHCTGGVSRSAAVAAAISCMIPGQDDWWVFKNSKYSPNETVYRSILTAGKFEQSESAIRSKFDCNQALVRW